MSCLLCHCDIVTSVAVNERDCTLSESHSLGKVFLADLCMTLPYYSSSSSSSSVANGACLRADARGLLRRRARPLALRRQSFVPPVVRSVSSIEAADAKAKVSFADEENIGRRVRSVQRELVLRCVFNSYSHSAYHHLHLCLCTHTAILKSEFQEQIRPEGKTWRR